VVSRIRRRLSRSCTRIRDVVGHLPGWYCAGFFLTEKWVESQGAASVNLLLGVLLLSAGAISVYLPPLVATFLSKKISYLASAPFFFLLPLLSVRCFLSFANWRFCRNKRRAAK